jgi:hypothetical protein
MKVLIYLSFLLVTGKYHSHSANVTPVLPFEKKTDSVLTIFQFRDYKIKELEKTAGRKFTFKEKMQIKLLKAFTKKGKYKKFYGNADPDKQATLSFVFALAALGLLIPGLLNIITGAAFLGIIPLLAILALWLGLKSKRAGKNFKNMFGIIAGGSIIVIGIVIALGAFSL